LALLAIIATNSTNVHYNLQTYIFNLYTWLQGQACRLNAQRPLNMRTC